MAFITTSTPAVYEFSVCQMGDTVIMCLSYVYPPFQIPYQAGIVFFIPQDQKTAREPKRWTLLTSSVCGQMQLCPQLSQKSTKMSPKRGDHFQNKVQFAVASCVRARPFGRSQKVPRRRYTVDFLVPMATPLNHLTFSFPPTPLFHLGVSVCSIYTRPKCKGRQSSVPRLSPLQGYTVHSTL